MAVKSIGDCYLCGAHLGKTAMEKHLLQFHKEYADGQECCLLKVEGAYREGYWFYMDVPIDKTLTIVDTFLRKIWLECCGHLSEFYDTDECKYGMETRKSRKLRSFPAGTKLYHIYDFGTTTKTIVTIMGVTTRKPQKKFVRVLARNTPPVFKCKDCGKPSDYICIEYIEPFDILFYCAECSDKIEDDEHVMLPVTNSPRMGQCAYDGELDRYELEPIYFIKRLKQQ